MSLDEKPCEEKEVHRTRRVEQLRYEILCRYLAIKWAPTKSEQEWWEHEYRKRFKEHYLKIQKNT